MTVEKKMNLIIASLSGKVLCICPTNTILKSLDQNNAILVCDVLSKPEKTGEKKGHTKLFSMKRLKKKYHQKTLNTIIGEITGLDPYFKTFIHDSIDICKGDIYLYIEKIPYDYEKLQKRYQRYHVSFEIEQLENGYLFHISVGNRKTYYFQNKLNSVINFFSDMADFIGDALAS